MTLYGFDPQLFDFGGTPVQWDGDAQNIVQDPDYGDNVYTPDGNVFFDANRNQYTVDRTGGVHAVAPPQTSTPSPSQTPEQPPRNANPLAGIQLYQSDDGKTLANQSLNTQILFVNTYGANAGLVWAQQNNTAIHSNQPTPTVPTAPKPTTNVPPAASTPGSVGGHTPSSPKPVADTPKADTLTKVLTTSTNVPGVGEVPFGLLVLGAFVGLKALTGGRR